MQVKTKPVGTAQAVHHRSRIIVVGYDRSEESREALAHVAKLRRAGELVVGSRSHRFRFGARTSPGPR